MIGCKSICFFGEVPPRHERTKKKPYAGGNRAGTACRQTDTEEEPGKLAERTSQSFVCQVVRRKSAERCGSPAATSKGHWPFEAPTEPTGETGSLRGSRAAALPSDMMLRVISYWVLSGAKRRQIQQLRCCVFPRQAVETEECLSEINTTQRTSRSTRHLQPQAQ